MLHNREFYLRLLHFRLAAELSRRIISTANVVFVDNTLQHFRNHFQLPIGNVTKQRKRDINTLLHRNINESVINDLIPDRSLSPFVKTVTRNGTKKPTKYTNILTEQTRPSVTSATFPRKLFMNTMWLFISLSVNKQNYGKVHWLCRMRKKYGNRKLSSNQNDASVWRQ